jgi:hypothetical protein
MSDTQPGAQSQRPSNPAPAANPAIRAGQATPLRYSMRSLFILVTIVAVLAALLPYTGIGATLLIVGLVTLMFIGPVCLGTLALYCRGYKQTFFMGAFAGSLSTFYVSGMLPRYSSNLALLLILSVVGAGAAGACACIAVATRKFVERRGWNNLAEPPQRPNSD